MTHKKSERVKPYSPKSLVLLPSADCNLKCSYCYSDGGAKKTNLTKDAAKAAVEYILKLQNHRNKKNITFSYLGGGEPTYNWEVFIYSVEYIRKQCALLEIPVTIKVTTNGMIEKEKHSWIIENIDIIKVSFDGMRSIQNDQRQAYAGDSYEVTKDFLKQLDHNKKKYQISCTVTNNSLKKLDEIYDYLSKNYSSDSLILNPAYSLGRGEENYFNADKNIFVSKFSKIQKKSAVSKLKVHTPYDQLNNQKTFREPFCGFERGKVYQTPDGYISMCPKVDSRNNPFMNIFGIGYWDESTQSMKINDKKFKQVCRLLYKINNKDCTSCLIRSFCPGSCLFKRLMSIDKDELLKMRIGKDCIDELSEDEFGFLENSNKPKLSEEDCLYKILLSKELSREKST